MTTNTSTDELVLHPIYHISEDICNQNIEASAHKNNCISEGSSKYKELYKRICCPVWCESEQAIVVAHVCAVCMFILMIWGVLYSLLGEMAVPMHGQLFMLGILGMVAHLSGWLVSLIGITPLLGMMIAGTLLRSFDVVVFSGGFLEVSATIRHTALVIILIKAGLGLDPAALKRLGCVVLRIAILPAVIEAVVVAGMIKLLLDLPLIWGFLLGAVLAAVSPDVVIPCLFSLETKGNYGKSKGIPTIVIAAASFDDVLAISVFGVLLSVIFSTGDLTSVIIECPVGLVIGIACGLILGFLLRYIPNNKDNYATTFRTLLLFGGGMFVMLGSSTIGYEAAGPIGCIITSFIAGNGWEKTNVENNFILLLMIFQPIQFGLIGAEVNFFLLDGKIVGLGSVSLLVALGARIAASIVIAAGANLNWKEKIFISLAWFPKATVQAALGPIALDKARQLNSAEFEEYSNVILVIAVLSILITAPVGATFITLLGPKLLQKEQDTV